MITKEKVIEILEQHAYRSAVAGRIVVYETNFEDIADEVVKNCSIPDVIGSLPLTFEECLREEFLINTQNYPKEYHNLFFKKFDRAKNRFEEQ